MYHTLQYMKGSIQIKRYNRHDSNIENFYLSRSFPQIEIFVYSQTKVISFSPTQNLNCVI